MSTAFLKRVSSAEMGSICTPTEVEHTSAHTSSRVSLKADGKSHTLEEARDRLIRNSLWRYVTFYTVVKIEHWLSNRK